MMVLNSLQEELDMHAGLGFNILDCRCVAIFNFIKKKFPVTKNWEINVVTVHNDCN